MFVLGDMTIRYPRDTPTGTAGLEIVPTASVAAEVPARERIDEAAARHHPGTGPARTVEPLRPPPWATARHPGVRRA